MHEEHIAAHLLYITQTYGDTSSSRVLVEAGLTYDGGKLGTAFGAFVDDERLCKRYLDAVQSALGPAALSFAKVRFVLSGCKCCYRSRCG